MTPPDTGAVLQAGDIVPDLSLDKVKVGGRVPADADLLNHQAVAQRVTELATASKNSANVAIFAPWGAGKSSLFGLMEEQLEDRGFNHVTFDAWKHSGDRFQANFLSEVSSELEKKQNQTAPVGQTRTAKRAQTAKRSRTPDPATALYQSRRQVQIPWLSSIPRWARLPLLVLVFAVWIPLPAFLWALHRNAWAINDAYPPLYLHTLREWVVIALGGGIIAVVIGIIASVSQVSIEQSQPSSVKQFKDLFDKILKERAGGKRTVIFIDELDRCEPKDVVGTLDGLRTFLQHEDCIFVVAFDRDSVAAAIGARGTGRSDGEVAPYYLTAGEYLDKVFQFQVSLPPQTRHTLRTYATRLVETRDGIWSDLRHKSPDLFSSVIRLLAPAHIGSPRRMKVLLNSFAVNMRLYEGFGFPVLDRAEAIAVLTVLQTEFPRFAADVEREPELLRAYAWKTEPTRPKLADLYGQWSKEETAPEIDRLIGDGKSTDKEKTSKALRANLRAYLDRVVDMGSDLPTPDLIHVHAGDDQQKFDDSGVYSALRLARDYPRPETLSELQGASNHDLIAGIRFLEHEIENSDIVEADGLRLLIGEVLADADDEVIHASRRDAVDAWRSRRTMPFPARTNEVRPFYGFARAFLASTDRVAFDTFLSNAFEVGQAGDAVIEWAIEHATTDEWERHAQSLRSRSINLLPVSPAAFTAFLVRYDTSPAGALPSGLAAQLIDQFFPAEPEEPDLSGLPPVKQSSEHQAHLDAVEQHAERTETSAKVLPQLLQLEVAEDGAVRQLLLRTARAAEPTVPTVAAIHDQVIVGTDPAITDSHLLEAIAERPAERGRWLGRLSKTDQPAEIVRAALDSVMNPKITATADERASAALFIAQEAHQPDHAYADAVANLRDLIIRYLDGGNASKFEPVRAALAAIDRLEPESAVRREIRADAYVVAATTINITGPQALATMLQTLRREDDAVLEPVVADLSDFLDEGGPDPAPMLTLIAAQRILSSRGRPVTPLQATTIAPALETMPAIAIQWLHTHPRFRDVLKPTVFPHLPVDAASEDMWDEYSARLTETGRTQIWAALRQRHAGAGVLAAVSGGDREISPELYVRERHAVLQAGLADDKKLAFDFYKALPLNTRRAASSSIALIRELAETAASAEFPIAAYAANASRQHFHPSEESAVRELLARWSAPAQVRLPAALRDDLLLNGLIKRRPKKQR